MQTRRFQTATRCTGRIVRRCLVACLLVSLYFVRSPSCVAQTTVPVPSSQPSPPAQQPERIKIYTEEILLPVVATDSNGRFDPTLEADDLLILEDGVPQTIRSVRRIPASVLLLLDTGGARNPAMKTNATRDLSVRLVSQLRSGDQVAALQFGGKVELIHTWTTEPDVVIHSLKTKLFSGRRTRLGDALAAATAQLKDAPPGNRHVVLVTDGGESPLDDADLETAMKQLFATQATVHVVSYTLLGRKTIAELHPKIPVTLTSEKRKDANDTANEAMHPNERETLVSKLHNKLYMVIDTDYPMWRHNRDHLKTLKKNEQWLAGLAEESGGSMTLPASAEELPKLVDDLDREIDSQYVITYRPKKAVMLGSTEAIRRIEVVSRRVGLQVRSRRSYLVPASQ